MRASGAYLRSPIGIKFSRCGIAEVSNRLQITACLDIGASSQEHESDGEVLHLVDDIDRTSVAGPGYFLLV